MAKQKVENQAAAEAKVEAAVQPKEELKLENLPSELQKKLQEEAYAKVCSALKTTPAEINAVADQKKKSAEMREFNIGMQEVHINGRRYSGKGQARADVVEMILSMAGAQRQRMIAETIGRDHVVQMINNTVSSRVVGAQDISGQEVSIDG